MKRGGFQDQVKAQIAQEQGKMLKVLANAVQDVVEAAQTPQVAISRGATSFEVGKIPVASSVLIKSLTSDGIKGEASYVAALARLKIGMIMKFQWTEEYAMRIEHGFKGKDALGRYYNQAGRYFVAHNLARFSEFFDNWRKVIFK